MNQTAAVYNGGHLAGTLEKTDQGEYVFTYEDQYYNDIEMPAISLTLSKTRKTYKSVTLFPFFFGLLSEGANKQVQCKLLKIDEQDYFRLLLKTAFKDTIGAITIKEIAV